jgi:4-amino-4-deoxy-L-arabinose transferase-like glycosyltransferase
MIALFNEALFLIVVWQTFLLARGLFDKSVAWLSALTLLGCDLLWRFSASGLSTILLLLIFTLLIRCLVRYESEARETQGGRNRLLLLATTAGLLVGVGALTRYSFGWIIVPVLVFLGILAGIGGGGRRWLMPCIASALAFLVVLSPWVYRNFSVSGTPFGTAGLAIIQHDYSFMSERSLKAGQGGDYVKTTIRKLVINSQKILLDDLPKLAGGWVTPFFLVGLLLRMQSPAIRRLRYFVGATLLLFIVVQALGRTQLSSDSADINSENLLVLFVPLILIYGASLFLILLDQIELPFSRVRYVAMGLFVAILSLPLIYSFLPPRGGPLAFPPYAPQPIQESSGWMLKNELIMSDVPWAVAWYGDRQCVWLTLDAEDAFYEVSDYLKPVRALYLTQVTLDGKFQSEMLGLGDNSWGIFCIRLYLGGKLPPTFPMKTPAPARFFPPGHAFLTDRQRWESTSETPPADAAPPLVE